MWVKMKNCHIWKVVALQLNWPRHSDPWVTLAWLLAQKCDHVVHGYLKTPKQSSMMKIGVRMKNCHMWKETLQLNMPRQTTSGHVTVTLKLTLSWLLALINSTSPYMGSSSPWSRKTPKSVYCHIRSIVALQLNMPRQITSSHVTVTLGLTLAWLLTLIKSTSTYMGSSSPRSRNPPKKWLLPYKEYSGPSA